MLSTNDFDFAFSFAGEDRDVVQEIYNKLTAEGINIFYDYAYQSKLIGQDLYRGLRELYRNKARFIVCFVSEHYTKNIWTNLEFTAIKERLIATFFASDFLIPIIIGETEMLKDIPDFIGFYNHRSVQETVKILNEKINSSLSENHLITNVNNCIKYICPQIHQHLKAININSVPRENADEIVIDYYGNVTTYLFSGDTVAQTPCILVTKGMGSSDYEIIEKDPFPSLIITWKKQYILSFSIHEFNGNSSKAMKNQSLSETVKCISTIIEKDIRG